MSKRMVTVLTALLLALGMVAGPAAAHHAHDVNPPGPHCASDVGRGQTSIADSAHGGWHRFHDNVHVGATEEENKVLGKGNSRVEVGLGICD